MKPPILGVNHDDPWQVGLKWIKKILRSAGSLFRLGPYFNDLFWHAKKGMFSPDFSIPIGVFIPHLETGN